MSTSCRKKLRARTMFVSSSLLRQVSDPALHLANNLALALSPSLSILIWQALRSIGVTALDDSHSRIHGANTSTLNAPPISKTLFDVADFAPTPFLSKPSLVPAGDHPMVLALDHSTRLIDCDPLMNATKRGIVNFVCASSAKSFASGHVQRTKAMT